MQTVPAFIDGNSLVYCSDKDHLVVANSDGIIKIFSVAEPDLEPASFDSIENITSISAYNENILATNTSGIVEKINTTKSENTQVFRSELPLRACAFINQGKRFVCGGDEPYIIVVDLETTSQVKVDVPDQVVDISYNPHVEVVVVSLVDGSVAVYSVASENPVLEGTYQNTTRGKLYTSLDHIDYLDEHSGELVSAKTLWSKQGHLLAPGSDSITVFDRTSMKEVRKIDVQDKIHDFVFSPNHTLLAVLANAVVTVLDFADGSVKQKFTLNLDKTVAINVAWTNHGLFVGTSGGHIIKLDAKDASARFHAEESMIIDEADEDENDEGDDVFDEEEDPLKYYNRSVDDVFDDRVLKRAKLNGNGPIAPPVVRTDDRIVPYSPGSTPWSQTDTTQRRYLSMNSVGYAWAVQTGDGQQTVTVSFFDRSANKDYHFLDHAKFDLTSINSRGIVLASSATGKIFYRHHNTVNDSWERQVPLLKDEYLTSVSITENNNSTIVVSSNLGYVRFFNLYGLCINLMKTTPVVTLVSSSASTLFMINQVSNVFTYSLIDMDLDYKFIQQNVLMPLQRSPGKPLVKGLFFNEYNDPCFIAGSDDTLLILGSWRDSNNAKWIPILNCSDVVTDYGNDMKKHWKSWPLGLYRDQLNCLILKSNSIYPGFPLSLPVEIGIQLPILVVEKKKKKKKSPEADLFNEYEPEEDVDRSNDPEENFLRASTMGKIMSDTLNDEDIAGDDEDNEEVLERLQQYSVVFDKSLLKLFANSCEESRLNKALSIVRLIKNDKALLAAAKIAERFEFLNLAAKIGKLRDELVDLEDDTT